MSRKVLITLLIIALVIAGWIYFQSTQPKAAKMEIPTPEPPCSLEVSIKDSQETLLVDPIVVKLEPQISQLGGTYWYLTKESTNALNSSIDKIREQVFISLGTPYHSIFWVGTEDLNQDWLTGGSTQCRKALEGGKVTIFLELHGQINGDSSWEIDGDLATFTDGKSFAQILLPVTTVGEALSYNSVRAGSYWTEGDPAQVSEPTGSFRIEWGSSEAVYLKKTLDRLWGDVVYRDLNGITYGVITQ